MKPSPLQLEWVTYPKLSYEANADWRDEERDPGMPIECEADIVYARDGRHVAELTIRNQASSKEQQPYFFEVNVFARFRMDVEIAKQTYTGPGFPRIAAVNVSRILLSSARDLLSTVTARSPYGAAMIQSVLLEPGDVKVSYEGDMESFKREIFGIGQDVTGNDVASAGKEVPSKARPKRTKKKAAQ